MPLPRWAPKIRLRLRSLMVMVAFGGLLAWGLGGLDRYFACMERSDYYSIQAVALREDLVALDRRIRANIDPEEGDYRVQADVEGLKAAREQVRKLADRCDDLAEEFARAAWLPFLSLPNEGETPAFLLPPLSTP